MRLKIQMPVAWLAKSWVYNLLLLRALLGGAFHQIWPHDSLIRLKQCFTSQCRKLRQRLDNNLPGNVFKVTCSGESPKPAGGAIKGTCTWSFFSVSLKKDNLLITDVLKLVNTYKFIPAINLIYH